MDDITKRQRLRRRRRRQLGVMTSYRRKGAHQHCRRPKTPWMYKHNFLYYIYHQSYDQRSLAIATLERTDRRMKQNSPRALHFDKTFPSYLSTSHPRGIGNSKANQPPPPQQLGTRENKTRRGSKNHQPLLHVRYRMRTTLDFFICVKKIHGLEQVGSPRRSSFHDQRVESLVPFGLGGII
ncbi:hypothetical protein LZ30DRAFT_173790 [Colletotrichum cereale]|nr:hypothetical protein LZ30DRAFT_173790 [Colletotrichum cereale]